MITLSSIHALPLQYLVTPRYNEVNQIQTFVVFSILLLNSKYLGWVGVRNNVAYFKPILYVYVNGAGDFLQGVTTNSVIQKHPF